jgi:pimeloyl-CoA synthetase
VDITPQIQQIQKQIQVLNKYITKENASSDAAKTKQELVQEYQLEIVALELQIQQIQQQAAQQAAAKAAQQTATSSRQSASQNSTDSGQANRNRPILDTTA